MVDCACLCGLRFGLGRADLGADPMTQGNDMTAEPIAWLIDLDGTGSLHAASREDTGAIPVYDAAALTALQADLAAAVAWAEKAEGALRDIDNEYDPSEGCSNAEAMVYIARAALPDAAEKGEK